MVCRNRHRLGSLLYVSAFCFTIGLIFTLGNHEIQREPGEPRKAAYAAGSEPMRFPMAVDKILPDLSIEGTIYLPFGVDMRHQVAKLPMPTKITAQSFNAFKTNIERGDLYVEPISDPIKGTHIVRLWLRSPDGAWIDVQDDLASGERVTLHLDPLEH